MKSKQISESIGVGILLAISGGFMDAYSYIERGKVFANAQTGNMLLLGIHLSEGHIALALHYLFPVCAFAIGIIIADLARLKKGDRLHWRQISVLLEALVLTIVSFMPQSMNLLANSLTSLACGLQVESFRKIQGQSIATTMCIGNLRSGTENMSHFFSTKQLEYFLKAMLYYGIIVCFIIGAVLGNGLIKILSEQAILGCSVILMIVFLLMFIHNEKANQMS